MGKLRPLIIKLEHCEKFTRLLAQGTQSQKMKSGLVVLQPGEEVGEHSTESKEEAIVVLEGKAQVLAESFPLEITEANSFIYLPANLKHNIKNPGSIPLKYIYITSNL